MLRKIEGQFPDISIKCQKIDFLLSVTPTCSWEKKEYFRMFFYNIRVQFVPTPPIGANVASMRNRTRAKKEQSTYKRGEIIHYPARLG